MSAIGESGHRQVAVECPLLDNSGHLAQKPQRVLFDRHLVCPVRQLGLGDQFGVVWRSTPNGDAGRDHHNQRNQHIHDSLPVQIIASLTRGVLPREFGLYPSPDFLECEPVHIPSHKIG